MSLSMMRLHLPLHHDAWTRKLDVMRTTIDLESELLAAAKERAMKRKTTLSRIVQDAVKAYLEAAPAGEEPAPFELLTAGRPGGLFPSPQEVSSLLDEDETQGQPR